MDNYTSKTPNSSTLRIGISKKPVHRESKNAHYQIEHRTVSIDELCDCIQRGHALGAICAGKHVYENFLGRQDIQLDIDAADFGDNPLPYFLNHPFVQQFGYVVYRTRTPGHCRLLFRLSKQVTNPVEYKRYADALATLFAADPTATSPVQLWYTYEGCDVAIVGQTLPMAELKRVARTYSDSDDYQAPTQLADPETLLQQAVDSAEGRNVSGYGLALSLRRLNMPQEIAYRYMTRYQAIVGTRGTHTYTVDEALDSLNSAYRHRKHTDSAMIDRARTAVVTGQISLPVNVRRTAIAVLDAMAQIGRTTTVELSVRQISRAASGHIDKQTVHAHLKKLNSTGLLRTYKNSDNRLTHSLLSHEIMCNVQTQQTGIEGAGNTLCNPIPVCCVSETHIISAFQELQHSSATEPHAKIHTALTTTESDMLIRLGGGAQAVIAALAAAENGTTADMDTLIVLCSVSRRIVSNVVRSLQLLGLVTVTPNPTDRRKKSVTLCPSWRGKLVDIEPLLTTYGRDILREELHTQQRVSFHAHIADHADSDETRATHDALVQRAQAELTVIDVRKQAAMAARRDAAQSIGLDPAQAPAISLRSERKPKKRTTVTVAGANGEPIQRRIIPSEAKTTTNRQTQRERVVDRILLGHVGDDGFGEVERVTVTDRAPMHSAKTKRWLDNLDRLERSVSTQPAQYEVWI